MGTTATEKEDQMDETGMTPRIVVPDHVDAHIVMEALSVFGNATIDAFASAEKVTETDLLATIAFTDRITALMHAISLDCHNSKEGD